MNYSADLAPEAEDGMYRFGIFFRYSQDETMLYVQAIGAVYREFDAHGEAEYRRRWKNGVFPSQEYRDLLDLCRGLADAGPSS